MYFLLNICLITKKAVILCSVYMQYKNQDI